MKNYLVLVLNFILVSSTLAQEVTKESKLKLQGGLWLGINENTKTLTIPAGKLSVLFRTSPQTKLEVGAMLMPGLISDKAGVRFGLSGGIMAILHKSSWKRKLVAGLVLAKTDTWQVMPGIGFVF